MQGKRKRVTSVENDTIAIPASKRITSTLNDIFLAAVSSNNIDEVQSLLMFPISLHYCNAMKQSALYIACACGFVEIVEILLARKNTQQLDLEKMNGPLGALPIHIACDNGHINCLKLLQLNNECTEDGRSALYFCAQSNRSKCMEYLLACQTINVLLPDKNGVTPLHIACQLGCWDAVTVLLNNVNHIALRRMLAAKDCAGFTPLHTAAWTDNRRIVALLLKKGADPDIYNDDHEIPMDLANDFIVRLILSGKISWVTE
jgi:ankyrin repeat protein